LVGLEVLQWVRGQPGLRGLGIVVLKSLPWNREFVEVIKEFEEFGPALQGFAAF
jgi:hypothetical protein